MYDNNHFKSYCNLGSCFRLQNKYMESKKYYGKALAIKSDDAISHYNLANIDRVTGNYEASIDHYLFVIDLKQGKKQDIGNLYLNSLVNLGICYKIIGHFDKAIETYEKVYKIDPNDETALYNHSMVLVDQIKKLNSKTFQEVTKFKIEAAVKMFNRLLQINENNFMAKFQIIRMSHNLDASTDNISKSIVKLKQLLNTPNCNISVEINEELGYCLHLQKDYESSANHYQKSVTNFYKKKGSQGDVNKYDSQASYTNQPINTKVKHTE